MIDAPVVVYVETTMFIYALEGRPEVQLPAQRLLKMLRHRPGIALTSELNLAEVLAPSRTGRKRQPHLQREYLDLIIWSRFVALYPVSRSILLETVKLRATKAAAKLKLPDAIHLATAIRMGCNFFASNDTKIPLPRGMHRVTSDEESVAQAIEALS